MFVMMMKDFIGFVVNSIQEFVLFTSTSQPTPGMIKFLGASPSLRLEQAMGVLYLLRMRTQT